MDNLIRNVNKLTLRFFYYDGLFSCIKDTLTKREIHFIENMVLASQGYAIFCSYKMLVRNIQITFEWGYFSMLTCHVFFVFIVLRSRCKHVE